MEDIDQDLDICAEIYDLINMYKIHGAEKDEEAFEEITPRLSHLREIIDDKVANRNTFIEQLVEHFNVDSEDIYKDIAEIREIIEVRITINNHLRTVNAEHEPFPI